MQKIDIDQRLESFFIYKEYLNNPKVLENYNTLDLIEYSRYLLDDIPNLVDNIQVNFDICKILLKQFVDGKTKEDRVVWDFVRHLSKCLSSEKQNETIELIKKFIEDKKIIIKIKYLFFDCFLIENKVNFDIVNQFDAVLIANEKLQSLILKVFDDCINIYSKKSIYDYEDEVGYILYSTWSGKKDEKDKINQLRLIAKKDLENRPDKIKEHWASLIINNIGEVHEIIARIHINTFQKIIHQTQVYLPMKELITLTEKVKIDDDEILKTKDFWKEKFNNTKYKDWFKIKEYNDTLHGRILEKFAK